MLTTMTARTVGRRREEQGRPRATFQTSFKTTPRDHGPPNWGSRRSIESHDAPRRARLAGRSAADGPSSDAARR
eukprot:CAMPEP_0185711320 /NCGR_PEP_ID=MMETSP1164-20130828/32631_1 /TAXON_ID=1104430 /ORGANISM="Chrysoreinhardia sp, Strain CCMP2950" /LENGTH=73 /DNA_ID=CAMNT_0028378857 /DNA_START=529 /DNA_END=746 /DNA_ORIENTATION=-